MLIKCIEIRNFRKLARPVRLDGLQPGLNVIAGDNEEGKSTVLEAVRAALFDRHNLTGEGASSFQPFGSAVRPEVRLAFELGGEEYHLAKSFCQNQSAELHTSDKAFNGPAAEERLRELLGFTPPGRGRSSPEEHHGILGLLWVTQGTAFDPLKLGESSHNALRTALEAEVGEVLGGELGEQVLRRIAQACETFFTSTGRHRGPYKDAEDTVMRLEQQLSEVKGELSAYEDKVDRLQRHQGDLLELDKPEVRTDLERRLMQAQSAMTQLQALRKDLEEAEQAERLALAEAKEPATRWAQRQHEILAVEQSRGELEKLEQAVADAEPVMQRAEDAVRDRAEKLEAADRALATAQEQETEAETGLRLATVAKRKEELDVAHGQALRITEELRDVRQSLSAIRIGEGDLEELQDLQDKLIRAEAAVEAGATWVDLALTVAVTQDGEAIQSNGRLALTAPTTFTLDGVGSLTITPGGQGLEKATENRDQARAHLGRRLAALGVATLNDAWTTWQARHRLETQVKSLQDQLAAYAPEGLDALAREIAEIEIELAPFDGQSRIEPGVASEALQEAKSQRQEAFRRREEANRDLETARTDRDKLKLVLAEQEGRLKALADQKEALERALAQMRAAEPDADLFRAKQEAEQAVAAAAAQVVEARARLQESQPEFVELQFETADRALRQHEERVGKLKQATHELHIELRSSGQMELGECRAELQARLEQARLQLNSIRREAESLHLLNTVLREAARQARQTFLEPVTRRVKPYLGMLIPGAELMLDEQMNLSGICRGGIEEPFHSLSVGTREQLAVLTRLAFAELLSERGQPVVLILDDALVYSDEGRFEQMKLITARAAKRFQILVLTCRESDYRSLGAPTWRLADCIVG